MSKTKERSAEEFYRGKLREANKRIRQLQRELKKHQKHEHMYETLLDEVAEEVDENIRPKKCTSCGKGNIKTIDIVGRIFEVCETCGERKKISK